MSEIKKCLVCGVEVPPSTRGMCIPCYSSAKRQVNAGLTSWELLETANLAAPPTNRGGHNKTEACVKIQQTGWGWREQAFAHLGYIRDHMKPEEVLIVQEFLRS